MSSNISSTTATTNEIFNMFSEYNLEEDMLQIEAQLNIFSDQFNELIGINIQALEEKQNKEQKLNKIKFSIRKTRKSLRKGNKISVIQANTQPIVERNSFKNDDFNNQYFEAPKYQGNQGEWHQEGQEAQEGQIAIPLQQNGFQQQNLLLLDQQDIITLNVVDQSITRNINNLKNNSKSFSSSSSSLFSN